MGKTPSWQRYEDRLARVTAYIHDHLDEDIDLNRLAEIACLSPYHWHRIYRAVHGETVAATVKRVRLSRAAGHLAHSDMPVDQVARKCGYPNLQSFTRIFSAAYGMPPAQYRKSGGHARLREQTREGVQGMYDVTIKTLDDMTAATVEHRGPYMEVGRSFEAVFGWLAVRNLMGQVQKTIGIYYDDPDAVPEDQLRSRAGVVIADGFAVEPPLELTPIAGGDYAVLRYKGPYADMPEAYRWFYSEWLKESGREAADQPMFEDYLNNPRDTAPSDLLTDIYMPLVRDDKKSK